MNTNAERPRNNMKSPSSQRETIAIGRKLDSLKMTSGRNNYSLTNSLKKEELGKKP